MAFPGIERDQALVELSVIPCLMLVAVLKLPELRIDPVTVRILAGCWPIPKLKPESRLSVLADSETRSLSLDLCLKLAVSLDPLA